MSSPGRPPSLLTRPSVALVWLSGMFAGIGQHALTVVIPFLIYTDTGSPLITAVTVLATFAPPVVLSQVAGVTADRRDRRRVLIAANIVMAVLTAAYLLVSTDLWWTVAALNFARSSAAQFLGPASHALLPDLVERERLPDIAGLNALNDNLARLIGPALGGILFAAWGLSGTLAITTMTFVIASCSVGLARVPRRATTAAADDVSWWRRWREGFATARGEPLLRWLLAAMLLLAFGEGFISALIAPFVHDVLRSEAAVLGWVLSAQACGGILGSLWFTRRQKQHHPMKLIGLSAISCGLLLAVTFTYPLLHPSPIPALALAAAAGVPFAVVAAGQTLLLQTQVEAEQRGRTFALFWGLSSLLQLTGIAVAGMAADRWGPLVILTDAVVYVVGGMVALIAWARHRQG